MRRFLAGLFQRTPNFARFAFVLPRGRAVTITIPVDLSDEEANAIESTFRSMLESHGLQQSGEERQHEAVN